ncbi:M13 family metallopeptidase [Mycoplasma buteonis]|uniref:M13 family metallopeptidase n=1 Tax=Mycoplasma buteonis TaxID=171280 RepID=UPI00056C6E2F|nr:M13 family metallopeptidase [Mycoplasma buteonis]
MTRNLKDDFYEYVNEDWVKSAQIPADKPLTSAFAEMDLELEKLLKDLVKKWAENPTTIPDNKHLHQMIKLYKMILDTKMRDKLGWSKAKSVLDEILELKSFKQIADNFKEYEYKFSSLPISFGVSQDFVNNKIKVLWIGEPGTILPSKENYEKEDKDKFLSVWRKMNYELAIDYGLESEVVNKMLDEAIKFDDLVKNYVLSSEQKADYVSLYNPKELDYFSNKSKYFDLVKIGKELVNNKELKQIVLDNTNYLENLDVLYNEDTFKGFKALMFFNNLRSKAPYITEKTREIASQYRNALYSIDKVRSLEDFAYDTISNYFKMPLGMYYATEYFGKEAKENVEKMVASMIQIYDSRLASNNWLSPDTVKKARLKLSKLGVMVGYPEEIETYYDKFIFKDYSENGDLVTNLDLVSRILTEHAYNQYLELTNPKLWSMSPAMINAYFHPFFNHIVFPAAILSYPFYDIKQSSSANYGGIGAVIAHEISHAFDNNGAQFDENGSLNNWWTENDYKMFKEKTQKAIELFDGIETEVGKVNGKLTVSENIADMGGFSCALEAAQKEPDFNAKEFFENWARIWRILCKPEAAKRRLESDPHAPGKQRANVQLSNCDLFYNEYNITENDGMYVAPEKRVKIW